MIPSWIIGDSNTAKLEGSAAWRSAFPGCRIYGTGALSAKDFKASYVLDGAGTADRTNFPVQWNLQGDGVLMLGSNDIAISGENGYTVSANIVQIAQLIRRDLTDGDCAICKIIPRYNYATSAAEYEAVRGPTNSLLQSAVTGGGFKVFEIAGLIYPSDYVDAVHLGESGISKLIMAIEGV